MSVGRARRDGVGGDLRCPAELQVHVGERPEVIELGGGAPQSPAAGTPKLTPSKRARKRSAMSRQ